MNKKSASLVFLAVCLMLAILLLTKTITPMVSGSVFAVALVTLGLMSRGFRNDERKKPTQAG